VTLLDSLDRLGEHHRNAAPMAMESLGLKSGFVLYDTTIEEKEGLNTLRLKELHDRAVVMIDGEIVATRQRSVDESDIVLENRTKQSRLSILVENMGRINFGMDMFDKKGLTAIVHHHLKLFDVDSIALPMDNLQNLEFGEMPLTLQNTPAFFKGSFNVDVVKDTFIKLEGFNRGLILINGINIGRFDLKLGPQKTLFVPAPFLKQGKNEVIIFDGEKSSGVKASFTNVYET
jgi:beta-galactosidase